MLAWREGLDATVNAVRRRRGHFREVRVKADDEQFPVAGAKCREDRFQSVQLVGQFWALSLVLRETIDKQRLLVVSKLEDEIFGEFFEPHAKIGEVFFHLLF